MKPIPFFETSDTIHLKKQRRIPESLNPQKQCCEKLKLRITLRLLELSQALPFRPSKCSIKKKMNMVR
jgi:hypothetical protein